MEHHGWDWSADDEGSAADADTADLAGEDDLGDLGGHFGEHDFGDADLGPDHLDVPDLAGVHDLGGDGGDLSGHHLGPGHDLGGHGVTPGDALDEPLGTEHATAHFDEAIAHHGDADLHDVDSHDIHDVHDDGAPDAGHHGGGDGPDGPDDHHHGTFDDGDPDDGRPEALVGTDPDLHHGADDPGWHDHAFPPELGITDPPEPVDGFPWSDPSTLGADGAHDDYTHLVDSSHSTPPATDLAQYAGIDVPPGGDAWSALLGSDDPATSTLARWWVPGT